MEYGDTEHTNQGQIMEVGEAWKKYGPCLVLWSGSEMILDGIVDLGPTYLTRVAASFGDVTVLLYTCLQVTVLDWFEPKVEPIDFGALELRVIANCLTDYELTPERFARSLERSGSNIDQLIKQVSDHLRTEYHHWGRITGPEQVMSLPEDHPGFVSPDYAAEYEREVNDAWSQWREFIKGKLEADMKRLSPEFAKPKPTCICIGAPARKCPEHGGE